MTPRWSRLDQTLEGRPFLHKVRRGEGPPLLLVHGIGPGTTGDANFAPLIAALPKDWTIHIIDLVGFGESPPRPEAPGFTPELWLEQIAQALDAVGEPCLLIGNSVGGALALGAAATRQDLLGVLAIGAAIAASPATPALQAFWRTPETMAALADAMRAMTADQAAPAAGLVLSRWRAFENVAYARWFGATLADPDACLAALVLTPAQIAAIGAPVHIMHGRKDRACPVGPLVAYALKHLPEADMTILGACGHNVMSERTAEVASAINLLRTMSSPR
jgi:pimeloyl-ACP methyl ester carboxylesterase